MENSGRTANGGRRLRRALSALGKAGLRSGLKGCPLEHLAARSWLQQRIRKRFDTKRFIFRASACTLENAGDERWTLVGYRSQNSWSASVLVDAYKTSDGAGGGSTRSLILSEKTVAEIVKRADASLSRGKQLAAALPRRLFLSTDGARELSLRPIAAEEGGAAALAESKVAKDSATSASPMSPLSKPMRVGDHVACPWVDGEVYAGVIVHISRVVEGFPRPPMSFLDTEGNQSHGVDAGFALSTDTVLCDVVQDDGASVLACPAQILSRLAPSLSVERRHAVDAALIQFIDFGFPTESLRDAINHIGIERAEDGEVLLDMVSLLEESGGDAFRYWREADAEGPEEDEVWQKDWVE